MEDVRQQLLLDALTRNRAAREENAQRLLLTRTRLAELILKASEVGISGRMIARTAGLSRSYIVLILKNGDASSLTNLQLIEMGGARHG